MSTGEDTHTGSATDVTGAGDKAQAAAVPADKTEATAVPIFPTFPGPPAAAAAAAPAAEKRPFIPPWLRTALKSRRMWKTWARCMIATFVAMLFMVIGPTSRALGSSSTFFAVLSSMILPPMMPVSILLFALLTMGLGMCLGWAWGVAAWAAAHSVRNQALLQAQEQAVQTQAQAAGINPRLAMQSAIFQGAFLDPRSSAVHGAFIFLGCYFFGWIRATKPKLLLLTIFGTIILDLTCSFGPLFPTTTYTLPKVLILPAAAYMAVALVCAALFFPQSLNHQTLDTLVHKCLTPMLDHLRLHDMAQADAAAQSRIFSLQYMEAYREIEDQAKMLQLEVTRGRISAGQLEEVISKTRSLAAASLGLGSVVEMADERNRSMQEHAENPLPHMTHQGEAAYQTLTETEKADLLFDIKAETADLRTAAAAAFQGGIDFLQMINSSRWKRPPKEFPGPEVRAANLQRLRAALTTFRQSGRTEIMNKFADYFDPKTGQLLDWKLTSSTAPRLGPFRSFQFAATLTGFCLTLMDWLALLEIIEAGTPKNKFQFPGKFVQEVVRNANETSASGLNVQDDLADNGGTVDDDVTLHGEDKGADTKPKCRTLDPDAGPPRNALQKLGRVVTAAVRGMTGANGIFALKYGIVTMALWIPQVCVTSAKFTYMNRGLWALIMAQTGLGVSTGEQVYTFVTRMGGTCVGIVVGLVVWYVGAQRTSGGPYGVTAALMVGIGPFLFLRIACPVQSMGYHVMVAVTITFVVGYSWVDNHSAQTANQGTGYSLAGRRALLVIVGFAAAFVMILIPRPVSAKKSVRQGLAKNIGALGHLYGIEMAGLEHARNEENVNSAARRNAHREYFLRIFERLGALHVHIAYASFEPAVRGPWPKDKYLKLVRIQGSMLRSSSLLTAVYAQLEPQWCDRMSRDSDLMHPAFIADCFSLFSILRHSLRQGTALPPIIPIFERLAYHREFRQARKRAAAQVDHPEADLLQDERAALSTLKYSLTWENAHDEQFTLYATALIAIAHFIGGLNSLHREVLSLVGELDNEGFDLATERWRQAQRV